MIPDKALLDDSTDRFVGADGMLCIDLDALVENYRLISRRAAPAAVAGVVKADGYGLGAAAVVRALARAGCGRFFVAQFNEGVIARRAAPDAEIYVLNGVWSDGDDAMARQGLIPVLNSVGQVERWLGRARATGQRLPAAIQIDSGMSRLGLSAEGVDWLAATPDVFDALDVRLLITHFAVAETPDAVSNARQLAVFTDAASRLPPTPVSLANSAAGWAMAQARGDVVRAGIALYGVAPLPDEPNPMRPVVSVSARVIQLRRIEAGVGVGYGLTYRADSERLVATVAVGYADGWPRCLSSRGAVYFDGARLPILGRVSMDSLMADASDLPPGALKAGDMVELIGPHQTLEQVAELAGTIPYEILTNLSRRFPRRYLRSDLADE